MTSNILFLFEGEKPELNLFSHLNNIFFKKKPLCASYGSNIYSLYNKLHNDPDLDLLSLLGNITPNQKKSISEIYLFFDYDPQDPNATDQQLIKMLNLFNNETENGRLLISYPMIESIRHIKKGVNFKDTTINLAQCHNYKQYSAENCAKIFLDPRNYKNKTLWHYLINEHCKKLNYLMTNNFEFPKALTSQLDLFEKQQQKHILPKKEVSVLSSFPIFIADYLGYEATNKMINTQDLSIIEID